MVGKSMGSRDWDAHPPFIHADYKSTALRGPTKPLLAIPQSLSEMTGPVYGHEALDPLDHDLTKNAAKDGAPIGERILVTGRVLDESGVAQPNMLVEIWQANAAGRYVHIVDQHEAPLDPNFVGGGRCVSDDKGRYSFYTVKPGAYPWPNHANAWRPQHIHFSLFGPTIATRLVTQMYFPGDPLLDLDPIYLSTPEAARELLIADFSLAVTEPDFALGYIFDIILRGPLATPMES